MAKDIIVLTPNGRRQKVHCTADTSILQVLEDVCLKQGFQPSDYDLKHHNKILDLTTTIRFSNLPNLATLEMVEADRKREETNVTIGLQLEDGERRTADFPPNISLYDLISSLAPTELSSLQRPTVMYMRQEITGEVALRDRTLRQLGLIKGRAIIRLFNKQEVARQANVSAVYRIPATEEKETKHVNVQHHSNSDDSKVEKAADETPSTSTKTHDHKPFSAPDIISKLKESSKRQHINKQESIPEETPEKELQDKEEPKYNPTPIDVQATCSKQSTESVSQEDIERRLRIEEEVTFLGAQKAIAFMQPDEIEHDVEDLPDDFYDLTIEEARKLYHELQQQRVSLENAPLISANKREDLERESSLQRIKTYNNAVVRIQFPDRIIIQGVFSPSNTIEDVKNFIKEHLQNPEREFHIFTTPIKENIDPKTTLLDAKFVPCVHMHFKWLDDDVSQQTYLKQEIYAKKTASDAAGILASKYRAPSRRKFESTQRANIALPSTSKSSKVPKWFKN